MKDANAARGGFANSWALVICATWMGLSLVIADEMNIVLQSTRQEQKTNKIHRTRKGSHERKYYITYIKATHIICTVQWKRVK